MRELQGRISVAVGPTEKRGRKKKEEEKKREGISITKTQNKKSISEKEEGLGG